MPFNPRPDILSMPNIPKPLHGLNPRSLMGAKAWDAMRARVYASTQYHCAACGVHKSNAKKHQWLEAHELFDINYRKCRATLTEIVPLCHFCHAFIHSGLTRVRARNKQITPSEVRQIMGHGCDVLRSGGAKIFLGTSQLCQLVGVDCSDIECLPMPSDGGKWSDWRMVWNDMEYRGKFKSINDWQKVYS